MQLRRAVLVHINPMEGITPLAGGYLKAYAQREPELRNDWDIQLFNVTLDRPASSILRDLIDRQPDVLGFSTYVWNVRLIQRLLPPLRSLMPQTQFLLGGVQVMNHADDYVSNSWENVYVCNGEGEKTFREFLLEMGEAKPDWERVGGLTLQRDGAAITTPEHPRIKELDEIPSPYLEDIFSPDQLAIGLLETNRGCPYKCEYCFWGGAIGQKIHRLEGQRIRDEIAYMAKHRTKAVLICDANFGIFPQDVEVAQQFVESRQATGYPLRVTYSSAKNNPERAVEVATILAQGGVLSCQPISLQTMNPSALKLSKRDNISSETYFQIQRRMNDMGVPSFVEMIWPLPGETLESFKQGIQQLCTMGAQVFGVYPLVWLNNVGFEEKQADLGVVTLDEADSVSGGKVVIQTREVTHNEWIDGMIFANAVIMLFDCRGMFHTAAMLNALGVETFRDLFERWVAWMETAADNRLTELWRTGQHNFEEMYKFTWRGAVVEAVLHSHRQDFDLMLRQFAADNSHWFSHEHGPLIEAAIEFDILSRPYAYANTPMQVGIEPTRLHVIKQEKRAFEIDSPFDLPAIVDAIRSDGNPSWNESRVRIRIDHQRGQIFRMPFRRDEDHFQFCHQFVTEIVSHLPRVDSRRPTGSEAAQRTVSATGNTMPID